VDVRPPASLKVTILAEQPKLVAVGRDASPESCEASQISTFEVICAKELKSFGYATGEENAIQQTPLRPLFQLD